MRKIRLPQVGACALVVLAAAAGTPRAAAGQFDLTREELVIQARNLARSELARPVQPGPLVRTPPASAVFTASNDGSTVEVQGSVEAGSASFVASVSSPVGKGEETWLADLEGIRSGSTLGLALTGVKSWRRGPGQAEMLALCRWAVTHGAARADLDCTKGFDQGDFTTGAARDSLWRRVFLSHRPTLYSVEVKGGPETHDFLDASTYVRASDRRWNVSANAGVAMFTRLGLISGNVSYTGKWSDAAEVTQCAPVATNVSRCATLPLGRPVVGYRTVLRGGLKRFLSPRVGVAPRVSYRTDDHVWAADLPVYFVPASDGSLMGGAVAGWNSREHRVGIGAFVGKALGLKP